MSGVYWGGGDCCMELGSVGNCAPPPVVKRSAMPVPVTNDPVSVSRLPRSLASAAGMTGMSASMDTPQPETLFDFCVGGRREGVHLELARDRRDPDRKGCGDRSHVAGRGDPLPAVEAEAQAALEVGDLRIALGRASGRRRDVDAERTVGAEGARQPDLRVAGEDLIRQPQELSRAGEEVVLPAEHVVGLAGQEIDDAAVELEIGVADPESRAVVEGRLRTPAGGLGWLPKKSPSISADGRRLPICGD